MTVKWTQDTWHVWHVDTCAGITRIFAWSKYCLRMMKRFRALPLFLFLSTAFLAAQQSAGTTIDTKGVREELNKIKVAYGMRNGQFGFALYDVETGTLLEKERADESLLPASTMKTVTSAAAFHLLGTDYRFRTALEIDGTIESGVLKGNVIIRGGGDPSLGSDRYVDGGTDMGSILAIWVRKLKEAGIYQVDGDIIGDASIFEDALTPSTWVWSDIGNYYGAGACGLSFNENSYEIFFKPGKSVGSKAEFLYTNPPMPDIQFVNEMRTGSASSGDNGYVYGAQYTFLRYLRGTVPIGDTFSIKGSIPDPSLYTAQSLCEALQADSVIVTGKATTVRNLLLENKPVSTQRKEVYTHVSPPLKEIIYWLNKKSINLYAEHLVKIIGYTFLKDGSNESGTKAITEFWQRKGVSVDGLHMNDGSGLSRYNGVTPNQLASMLRLNVTEPWFLDFFNSLPVAGLSTDPGTLKNMCKGTAAECKLWAKSGYISRVRTYAGYVHTRSGKRLSFAMMANNYTCTNSQAKEYLEGLMVKLAEIP
jgi:serine-type D-Ala-D-Ala carboxypeptidase/endopeptidase (penicillin-binding protein 4)